MTDRSSKLFFSTILGCVSVSSLAFAASHYLPEFDETGFGEYDHIGVPSGGINSKYDECRDAGYNVTSCPEGYALSKQDECPFSINSGLYKRCRSLVEGCVDLGYSASCKEGYEPDLSQVCPYDPLYIKCKCASCFGYVYTEAEANAEGYEPTKLSNGDPDVCLSCTTKKYHRQPKACVGFNEDATTCGSANCGNLSGQYCKSGEVYKYKDCTTCPTPSCPEGEIDYETYWCQGALQCYWPAPGTIGCTQTACYDYPYSGSVTCLPGFLKKSCYDSCAGQRYKCEKAGGCEGYNLVSQSGCPYGYDECRDSSGMAHYKCATGCEGYNLTSQTGCPYGYDECKNSSGKTVYKCGACKPVAGICSDYTLATKTGCLLGYAECNNGCGTITYKCRDYKAGDPFLVNGSVIGKVLEVKNNIVVVASTPRSGISASIGDYCAMMGGGSWYAPDKNYGRRIFSMFSLGGWDYIRIEPTSSYYCVSSVVWGESSCKSSHYTLWSSCLAGFSNLE